MSAKTRQLLHAADDDLRWKHFDYQESLRRVRVVKVEIECFLNCSLFMEDGVQDAAYFAGLCDSERIVCVRFSAWGDLFTVWSDPPIPLSTDELMPIINLIVEHDFVHVPYDDLRQLYDGDNEFYKQERWDRFLNGRLQKEAASWWDRYFDYS